MKKQSFVVLLVIVAACGDDASTSDGASAGGATTSSSGASACTVSLHDGPNATCPPECPATTHGTAATFCTDQCAGPDDPCPAGTQCLQGPFGDYATCTPPCQNGTCPDKMRCSDDRCLPE